MATIQKRGEKYRAIVRKKGYTQTATFTRKRDAEAWAKEVEIAIENGVLEVYDDLSFADVIKRYLKEVTPSKKSAKRETLIFNFFLKNFPRIATKPLGDINKRDIALWRDTRLQSVSAASINREWNSLSAVYTHAQKVWGLSLPKNPFHSILRPDTPPPREQRISEQNISDFLFALKYDGKRAPQMQREKTAWSFLFALETAMRASEICKLEPEDIKDGLAHLRDTKNGSDRLVPLSDEAKRLLSLIELPLGLTSDQLSAIFRKYRPHHLAHIHFHDTRHEAISRMALKISNPMTLAKITGHKDVKVLLNTYYNPQGEDLAGLL